MTGECGNVIRTLGLEKAMLQHGYPIKRGVMVYGPNGKYPWLVEVKARTPDWKLVEGFTWQVRRSEFDQMLLAQAQARGIPISRGNVTQPLRADDGAVQGVRIKMADGGQQDIKAQVVVDASGQATFLCHSGVTSEKQLGRYDKQIAIFSQVTGAIREQGKHRDSTITFYQQKYHWAWFIPLDAEVVSVGVVVPASYFTSKRESRARFSCHASCAAQSRSGPALARIRFDGRRAGDSQLLVPDPHLYRQGLAVSRRRPSLY